MKTLPEGRSAAVGWKTKGKVLALTAGIPGSGKTTWALAAGFDTAISLDDCRRELWGDHTIQDGPGGVAALLQLHERKILDAMKQGLSIVVHNTHHLRAYRRGLIDLAHENEYLVQIIFFDADPEECQIRNRQRPDPVPEEVMDEFLLKFETPDPSEADRFFRLSDFPSPAVSAARVERNVASARLITFDETP